jgi:hypothetical protein
VPTQKNVFYVVLAAALALPLTQSIMLAHANWCGNQAAQTIVMRLPDSIPGWQREKSGNDIEQRDAMPPGAVIRRFYRDNNGDILAVMMRQTSAYRLHDFVDCAQSAGLHPQKIADVKIESGERNSPFQASIIRSVEYGKPELGITWFQNGSLTSSSQLGWKLLCGQKSSKLRPPICRQTFIYFVDCKQSDKVKLLTDAALGFYRSQI